jgi:phosphoglycolate phosphatase
VTARGVIFDLDGTLVDSIADIATATNVVLERFGRDPYPIEAYRGFIGNGIVVLMRRAWGLSDSGDFPELDDAVADLRREYTARCVQQTRPFPGVVDVLAELRRRDVAMAVLSNKPDAMTQNVVSTLFGADLFAFVSGERAGVPRKPDPLGARRAADAIGIGPTDCLVVGDLPVDVLTARFAGMRSAVVDWGLGDAASLRAAGPDHWLAAPDELLAYVRA